MNQSPEQNQPTPEDRARLANAQAAETQALNEYLQNRVLGLNVEVQRRDERIAELEQVVASYQHAPAAVSETSDEPTPK